ncbi:hypothetical protein WDU94_007306 [Cyamophila willieti]
MNIHAENVLLLISVIWLCVALVQCAPQRPAHNNPTPHKATQKLKAYKIEDLPGLSEAEIDANANELKELIREYGPKALLVFNHTKHYRKGFEENFSDYPDREAECTRRWKDFMSFFDVDGGMPFFKPWWWPRYEKPVTKAPRKTKRRRIWLSFGTRMWRKNISVSKMMRTTRTVKPKDYPLGASSTFEFYYYYYYYYYYYQVGFSGFIHRVRVISRAD